MIQPNKYVVAIPSYKRSVTIIKNTLHTLNSKKVPKSRIFIFVANKEEEDIYKKIVPKKLYRKIICGVIGLRDQRNFISSYFPEHQCIVQLDDDIKDVKILVPGKERSDRKLRPAENLHKFFIDAFYRCLVNNIDHENRPSRIKLDKSKSYIWGVYPVNNPFFMDFRVTDSLQFLVGPMFGIINRHSKDLVLELNEKEDYERTLRHYKKDGSVIRFWNVTIDTAYYSTPGGMQAENKDRFIEAEKSANWLVKKFPKYTKKWYKGKDKRPEVRIKD